MTTLFFPTPGAWSSTRLAGWKDFLIRYDDDDDDYEHFAADAFELYNATVLLAGMNITEAAESRCRRSRKGRVKSLLTIIMDFHRGERKPKVFSANIAFHSVIVLLFIVQIHRPDQWL